MNRKILVLAFIFSMCTVIKAQEVSSINLNQSHFGITGAILNGIGYAGITSYTPAINIHLIGTSIYGSSSNQYSTIGAVIETRSSDKKLDGFHMTTGLGFFSRIGKSSGVDYSAISIPIFIGIERIEGPVIVNGRIALYEFDSTIVSGTTTSGYSIANSAGISMTYLF